MRRVWPDVSVMLAWALITWSAFGFHPRAWAASVGLYLFTSTALKMRAAYLKSKAEAERRRVDSR